MGAIDLHPVLVKPDAGGFALDVACFVLVHCGHGAIDVLSLEPAELSPQRLQARERLAYVAGGEQSAGLHFEFGEM